MDDVLAQINRDLRSDQTPSHTLHEHMRPGEKDKSFFTFAPVTPPSTSSAALQILADCNKVPLSDFQFDPDPKPITPRKEVQRFCFKEIETHNRDGDILLAPGILLIPGNLFTPEKLPEAQPKSPRAPPQVSVVAEHSAKGSPAPPSSEMDSLDQSPKAPSQVSVAAKNSTEGGPARSPPKSVSQMQETRTSTQVSVVTGHPTLGTRARFSSGSVSLDQHLQEPPQVSVIAVDSEVGDPECSPPGSDLASSPPRTEPPPPR